MRSSRPISESLRIFIVSYHFPPYNTVAAVRMGKLARFLVRAGHDVRVVAADQSVVDRSLPVPIDAEQVDYIQPVDIDRLVDPVSLWRRLMRSGTVASSRANPPEATPRSIGASRLRQSLSETWRCLIHMPDKQAGWNVRLAPALAARCGEKLPDLILVSGPPFSAFWSVRRAAKRFGVPWVAEFRDLWADEAFPHDPAWRRAIDRRLEPWLMRGCAAIVSVSDPWTSLYAKKYGVPTTTVMNGFDPEDMPGAADPVAGLPLKIIHAGSIYRGRRDPTALFRALQHGGFSPEEIGVLFYGRGLDFVAERAAAENVEGFVALLPPVPYRQSLERQKSADILLLLQWDHSANIGNVPAKFFEYLGLRRPILVIGPENGIPARLVRERGAGLASSDPVEIAGWLRSKVDLKAQGDTLPDLPPTVHDGLSRDEQYVRLEAFFYEVAHGW